MAKKTKKKREKNKRISEKIELLRNEGKTGEQAAGEAEGMEREHRLGRHGVYHRKRAKRSSRRA